MTKHLDSLMRKEMTRKEFLGIIGFGMLSFFGFSGVLHLLTGKNLGQNSGMGYGSSAYGGGKD